MAAAEPRVADDDRHIRDLIEQLLFTNPGERVNRPEFGSGLGQLIFAPNSPELATAVQFLVQGALQQWLGDLIAVERVQVDAVDSALIRAGRLRRAAHTAARRRAVQPGSVR